MNTPHPAWLDLLTLWMTTHHREGIAVVFSNPLEHFDLIKTYFPFDEWTSLINAEYVILPCKTEKDALYLCNKTPKKCLATVWMNGKVLHENT